MLQRRKERVDKQSAVLRRSFKEHSYSHVVQKFQKNFDDEMKQLLYILTQGKRYETHIANLATRLDYNGYYSELFRDIELMQPLRQNNFV